MEALIRVAASSCNFFHATEISVSATAGPGIVWSKYNSELWRFPNLNELFIYYTWEETEGGQFGVSWRVEEARELVVGKLNEARSRQ